MDSVVCETGAVAPTQSGVCGRLLIINYKEMCGLAGVSNSIVCCVRVELRIWLKW
jgi:hypothetical protein